MTQVLELTARDPFITIQAKMPALQQGREEEQEFGAILSSRVSLRPCLKNESQGPSSVTVFLRSSVKQRHRR